MKTHILTQCTSIKKLRLLTIIILSSISIHVNAQDFPVQIPSHTHKDHCSRTLEVKGNIPTAKAINTNSLSKASCNYDTNAQWASLSSYALISAMRQNPNYDCYRAMFDYHSGYSPALFTNQKVRAVANEVRGLASSYNGTNSTGMYGLTIYLHVAIYLDFFQETINLDEQTYQTIRLAYGDLAENAYLLENNTYALELLREYLIVASSPEVRYDAKIVNATERVFKEILITRSWENITDEDEMRTYVGGLNSVYDGIFNNIDNAYEAALVADGKIIDLMGQIAIDNELIAAGGDLKFLWQNAVGGLTNLAQSDALIGRIESHLAAITNNSPRLSPSWAKAKGALNTYGDCSTYNLCQHPASIRLEVEDYLFPKTVSYDDGEMIIRTPLSDEKIQNLYHAAKQVQNQFFRMIQTDEPVAGDINETINMIVFGSKEQYDDYAPFLFGINTNNGGIYIESRATFYTWDRTVGVESSLSLESLFRHEYTHYLQGRYLVPGNWGASEIYNNSRLVWYEEGMADFFAGSSDIDGIQMLAQNTRSIINKGSGWPSLSTVFNSSYSSGNFYHYTYGNAAWYNWYLNNYYYLKQFFDYTRNNDITGFDNLVNNLRNNGHNSYNNFLNQVNEGTIEGWDPETQWVDDNQITLGTPIAVENEIETLPATTNVVIDMDAEGSYRRFKIEGKISGESYAGNNTDAAKKVINALDNVLTDIRENTLINNFKYTVGYFKNLDYGGSVPTADFVITGPLKDLAISDDPVAKFSSSYRETVAGGKVYFSNESTGYLSGITWGFPSGNPDEVIDDQTPEIQYDEPGEYNVNLTAMGNSGINDIKIREDYIKVYPANINDYCEASNNGNSDDIYITRVELSKLDAISGRSSYSDYTSRVAVLKTNQTATLKINTLFNYWIYNALGVWIDWNQDGDFEDTGEEIIHQYGPGPYQQEIIPPIDAVLGTTRMRVRLSYGSEDYITPCGAQNSSGEIEEYSIVVTEEQTTNNLPPSITLIKPTEGQVFVQKENIAIETDVEDDGKIDRVELRIDGNLLETDTASPYQWSHINSLNFLEPGLRTIEVTVYDDEGSTDTTSVQIMIEKAPITYCEAATQDESLHITRVQFGTIDNSSGHNPYSDYTTISTIVQQQTQVPININTINEHWTYNAIGVWIDWNQDGNFYEYGEEVYRAYGEGPYTGSITIPVDAKIETPLRMRVRMGYGSEDKITPCGNDIYIGEVEDYTIYVGEAPAPTCDDGIQNGDETGVDCGGSECPDCIPTCDDGVQNGDETGIDCGGSDCPVCPTCDDGIQNGDETGIDCGGSSCDACITYCVTGNQGTNYIAEVTFGNINVSTNNSSYTDNTNNSTILLRNQSETLIVRPGILGNWNYNTIGGWIDWNKDGDFNDADETVMMQRGVGPFSVNVTVPVTARQGRTTMRVRYNWYNDPDPCGTTGDEVEDYTIIIQGEIDQTPTCDDGIQNGDETGVDCGGSQCAPCTTNTGIIYVDIQDITVSSSAAWNPFTVETGDDNRYGAWYTGGSIKLETYGKDIICEGNTLNAKLLTVNEAVDQSRNFYDVYGQYNIASNTYTTSNGKEGFIGFRYQNNGETHYGWFHVLVAANGLSYTILDYAYQTNPEQTIYTTYITNSNKQTIRIEKDQIKVYPNPFTNDFIVNTSKLGKGKVIIKIYDIQGKLLIQKYYIRNPDTAILGNEIKASGNYFLKIETDETVKTLRVLKQ